jgi:hypothetical protein
MLENEKSWDRPSVYEYNIIYCTVNCWILEDSGDREWVNNEEELVWLKHDLYRPKVPRQNLLKLSIHKKWRAGG